MISIFVAPGCAQSEPRPDSAVEDASARDTSARDTSARDSSAPDSRADDTGSADSAPSSDGARDTTVFPDGASFDTSIPFPDAGGCRNDMDCDPGERCCGRGALKFCTTLPICP